MNKLINWIKKLFHKPIRKSFKDIEFGVMIIVRDSINQQFRVGRVCDIYDGYVGVYFPSIDMIKTCIRSSNGDWEIKED